MIPQAQFLTIGDNLPQIKQFLDEIIIQPKSVLKKWSQITNQTPAVKLGYIGQHLASLVTGVRGTGTGARGDDLADGSEVKSCNKIDQVDKCNVCHHRVMRYENTCPNCGSDNIERKDDSKWLFSVRSEDELKQYLKMNRVVLLLMDYPKFEENDFSDIRISVFEIYPNDKRMKVFGQLLTNHYNNIYLPKLRANEITNPMNLHPFGFQFYKCNPIKTFECTIKDVETSPAIRISHYIKPSAERGIQMPSLDMPTGLLKPNEWETMLDHADFDKQIRPLLKISVSLEELKAMPINDKRQALPVIDEKLRELIPLRPIISTRQRAQYHRS